MTNKGDMTNIRLGVRTYSGNMSDLVSGCINPVWNCSWKIFIDVIWNMQTGQGYSNKVQDC